MELREISLYEARYNDLPANTTGEGEVSTWYVLDDDEDHKGFMEITRNEEEDVSEISYFMIPDIYQGHGYGALMLEKFLDKYIPESEPDSSLIALFDYNGAHGDQFSELFSDHGFDISYTSFRECALPFEKVYKKLSSKKESEYKGKMMNLAEGMEIAFFGIRDQKDCPITLRDLREADHELSVVAMDEEGNLAGLLLATDDEDRREVTIADLYIPSDDKTLIRSILDFAVNNAATSNEVPELIVFAAANEKLEKLMHKLFGDPKTSEYVVAEAEFNLGKYVEQLRILKTLGR